MQVQAFAKLDHSHEASSPLERLISPAGISLISSDSEVLQKKDDIENNKSNLTKRRSLRKRKKKDNKVDISSDDDDEMIPKKRPKGKKTKKSSKGLKAAQKRKPSVRKLKHSKPLPFNNSKISDFFSKKTEEQGNTFNNTFNILNI